MYALDTSSLIKLWEDYPIENPANADLWNRFWDLCRQGLIVIPEATWDEVLEQKGDGLRAEIIKQKVKPVELDQSLEEEAEHLEAKYKSEGKLASRGTVSGADLQNIVFARKLGIALVSEEERTKHKYKIPKVCELPEVKVRCIDLNQMIQECGLL